jgi:cytidyltransferase-like protein
MPRRNQKRLIFRDMAYLTLKDLPAIREKHKNETIVFCSGSFDLVHAGHVLFFEDCKKQGDILVVLVACDENLKRAKGPTRPILTEAVRLKMLASLKPVDYVLKDGAPLTDSDPPFLHVESALRELKPEKYVVNDDAFDIPYRKEFAKQHGVELVILGRDCPPEFENISTSGIIKKIKQLTD